MRNHIASLVVSAGLSLGVAAVMLAGASAAATECVGAAGREVCELVENPPSCIVAVATSCEHCAVGILSDCGVEATPTFVPRVSQ